MSRAADELRASRARWALPGSAWDRFTKIMAAVLPVLAGLLLAAGLIWPLTQDREFSFILSKDEVILTNASVESATLRLDFTGEPSIAIQLDPAGAATLETAMRADPDGMVQLRVDGDDMGDRVNTPTETRGRITLPITGPDRPSQVARAAEFGLVMARPLPCPARVEVHPASVETP